ncbi:kinase-like domain-containing protein [Hysterangium stoloniferum]|nr:kinase-like domain-containing protein [Hysterangium stoloniferum]
MRDGTLSHATPRVLYLTISATLQAMSGRQQVFDELLEYKKTWNDTDAEQRLPIEYFWVRLQPWLASCGYMLRPRYHPGWIPSWRGTKKFSFSCEDGHRSVLLDAIRIETGELVAIKRVYHSELSQELDIGKFFSNGMLASDTKNHCVPVQQILEISTHLYNGVSLMVMPYLRCLDDPPFLTIGEAVEFFRQVIEGLQFMHKHNIAHRDCNYSNIMMDAKELYPDGFHPTRTDLDPNHTRSAKHYTRTERPPKYYLTDFGLSHFYDPREGPRLAMPIHGGDKSVPEYQGEGYFEESDPFPVDIYTIGNMIKTEFLDYGFDFMGPLVADMRQDDPSKRPTIDVVVSRFDSIRRSLRISQLRSRIVSRDEIPGTGWFFDLIHFFRSLRFILLRIPPVPLV